MLTTEDIAFAQKKCPVYADLYVECMDRTPFGLAPQRCRALRHAVTDCVSETPYKTLITSMKNSTAEERALIIEGVKNRA